MTKDFQYSKSVISVLALFFFHISLANISFIDLEKVPISSKDLAYLRDHYQLVDHWQMEWPYEEDKSVLSAELVAIHQRLSATFTNNLEQALLIGDISYYLHNLDEKGYFEHAVTYYSKAISIDQMDYRGYWFLANHYARGNVQIKSIAYFFKAEERLPDIEPASFWEDYTMAMAFANMPSHVNYAMDQARILLGEPSYFEQQLGDQFKSRLVVPNPDSLYNLREVWTGSDADDKIDFISRPLGFKILLDSSWNTRLFDYENRLSFVTIVPEAIPNDAGRKITYTIFFMVKVAEDGERLEDFVNKIVGKYPEINEIQSPFQDEKSIALELKDPKMYADIGGGHMQVVAMEREKPKYAGMLLEKPTEIPNSENSGLSFYQASSSLSRFEGRIFYTIMLDACEDIYSGASQKYLEVLLERTTIE